MTAYVFDRAQLPGRYKRSIVLEQQHNKNYNFLAAKSLDVLTDRLLDVTRTFPAAVQIGHPDLNPDLPADKITTLTTMNHIAPTNVIGEEEFFPFGSESLDLILSVLTLHSVNDLPGALIQMKRALKPDGFFVAALFGGETLYELRDCFHLAEQERTGGISPRIFPFADTQTMGGLMQRAGFALPVVDSDIVHVTYDSLMDLCHDLRGMGQTNIISARRKNFTPKTLFETAQDIYAQKYSDEAGRLIASFEIIYLAGWAPHDSQQKPLRPGSAETSLADHLGTTEHKM